MFIYWRTPDGDRRSLIDALTLTAGLALLSWTFLIRPYVNNPDADRAAEDRRDRLPARRRADARAARAAARAGGRPGEIRQLLTVGTIACLVSDTAYGAIQLHGTFHNGTIVDLGWALFYSAWGAAALHPTMTRLTDPVPRQQVEVSPVRLGLLMLASLIAPVVLLTAVPGSRVGRRGDRGLLRGALPAGADPAVGRGGVPPPRARPGTGAAAGQPVPGDGRRTCHRSPRPWSRAPSAPCSARTRKATRCSECRSTARSLAVARGTELGRGRRLGRAGRDLAAAGEGDGAGPDADAAATRAGADGPPACRRDAAVPADAAGQAVGDMPTGLIAVFGQRRVLSDLTGTFDLLAHQVALTLESDHAPPGGDPPAQRGLLPALVQDASDAIVIVDDDGTVKYATPSTVAIFGEVPVVGELFWDLVAPEEREEFARTFTRLRERARFGPRVVEQRIPRRDGSERPHPGPVQ